MSGGNGIDIAAVYQLLLRVADTQGVHTQVLNEHTRILDGHSSILDAQARVLNELSSVVNQHTRTLGDHTRVLNDHTHRLDDLSHGQTTLRQTLTEYHSSVIGHGILISQLEDRVRRIEHHLDLPPTA
jgi:hypothetical protein